jgi:hypothetical protein
MIGYLTPSAFWFGAPPALDIVATSDTRSRARRVTRTATLDGGAVINDGGLSEADRTMSLTLRTVTAEDAVALEQIAQYAPCLLALDHGLYEGYVDAFAFNGPRAARISFLVSRRVI